MTNAIAQRCKSFVGSIFVKCQAMFTNIFVDLIPPNSKERAHDCKIDVVNTPDRNLADRAETCSASAAKKIDQESFDQIVGVMRHENRAAAPTFCHFRKKFVTRSA